LVLLVFSDVNEEIVPDKPLATSLIVEHDEQLFVREQRHFRIGELFRLVLWVFKIYIREIKDLR
jgi:hypothetical protein